MGVHLCYGLGKKHMTEPRDAARMVEIANAMTQAIDRTISYIHMPVPFHGQTRITRPLSPQAVPIDRAVSGLIWRLTQVRRTTH